MASPGVFQTPSHFCVFNGTKAGRRHAERGEPFVVLYGFMLVLPNRRSFRRPARRYRTLYGYRGHRTQHRSSDHKSVHDARRGFFYVLSGTQLNGVSQGAYYGNDYQSHELPAGPRYVDPRDRACFLCADVLHSGMSVTPGAAGSTNFTVPVGSSPGRDAVRRGEWDRLGACLVSVAVMP